MNQTQTSKKHIFFDTCSLLKLYELPEDILYNIEVCLKANTLKPLITNLIQDEFYRNREKTLKEKFDIQSVILQPKKINFKNTTSIFLTGELYEDFMKKYKELTKAYNTWKKLQEKKIMQKKLYADSLINKIFQKAEILHYTPDIIATARDRRDLRYPPGKGSGYSDMTNWLTLQMEVKKLVKPAKDKFFAGIKGEYIYLCSEDGDYINYKSLLQQEFVNGAGIKIEIGNLKTILQDYLLPEMVKEIEAAYSEFYKTLRKEADYVNNVIMQLRPAIQQLALQAGNLQDLYQIQNIKKVMDVLNLTKK